MFSFIWFLVLGIFGLIMGVRALRNPDSWPFYRFKDKNGDTDEINVKFRGIILLALGVVFTILSFQYLI